MAKATKKKPAAKKPAPKKAAKPAAKKASPKKASKPAAKKPAPKKASKPSPKKPAPKKAAKPAPKKTVKKVAKPAPKPVVKKAVANVVKPAAKAISAKPKRVAPVDNRTRYSDKELQEFKDLILEKLEAAKAEVKYLNDQINRKDDNGTDDTENKFATMEDGSATMEREYLTQMSARQAQYIDHLEKALIRIENKTYGICRVTGKLIEKDRLRAVPHATLSMEAKMSQAKA